VGPSRPDASMARDLGAGQLDPGVLPHILLGAVTIDPLSTNASPRVASRLRYRPDHRCRTPNGFANDPPGPP
jgi:hypothetical protein